MRCVIEPGGRPNGRLLRWISTSHSHLHCADVPFTLTSDQMSDHGEETETHADEAAVEQVQPEQPAEKTATEDVKEPTPAQSLGPSESM